MRGATGTPFVVQFVGYSNSGKTTLVTRLIQRLRQEGYRVGVIKHDGHDFEMDRRGTDTWRFREAGAELVAIQSRTKTAWIEQRAVPLSELIARMTEAGAQIVLVEGFKQEAYPKVAVVRRPEDLELLSLVCNCIAVASWLALDGVPLPVFSIDDEEGIAGFLLARIQQQNQG